MHFTKMEGLGNDYVYVNCLKEKADDPGELAIRVSDRHFGIGSDGLILIKDSKIADFTMEMYNADGSRSEMCGNGIRCVGKYVYDHGLTDKTDISVETLAGIKYLHFVLEKKDETDRGTVRLVEVNMGAPILKPELVPVDLNELKKAGTEEADGKAFDQMICDYPVKIAGGDYRITCVSMGNPHCVSFVEDVDHFPIDEVGRVFESHPIFPRRVNAEFVEVVSRNYLKMRVYERGTGETFACGTGTCATVVAAILNGVTEDEVTVKLLGGELIIRWDREKNVIFMTGPAKTVFEGSIEI
ncbi:MAG: diaminopimelate epimerase [Eubacteriales bacterium]|nr:diaminopimelate epimerase [Eubacteriales bacterium]